MDLFDRIQAEEIRRIEAMGMTVSDVVRTLSSQEPEGIRGRPAYRDRTADEAIGNVMREQRKNRTRR